MNRQIGILCGRLALVVLLSLLATVGPSDGSRMTSTPAHAQTDAGTLLKTVNIPSEAQNCPGGTETSVSVIPARMVGITDNQKVLLGVSCLANTVPTNTTARTSLRTISYLDAGNPVPSSSPQSSTVVKSIVTPLTAADPPAATFLGWGAITTRVDKGDVAACSNTSDNKHAVYKIDISPFTSTADGTAVKLFNLPDGTASCDGLAWDPADNSFYQSFENGLTITQYAGAPPTQAGLVLASYATPLIPPNFPGANTPCQASGLAMAGPSLYVACGSSTTMLQITKSFPAPIVVASNTIASGHQLQDAECDPSWAGMDAIWSKDKVNNQLFAFQVPNFTCGFATTEPAIQNVVPLPAQCATINPDTNAPYNDPDTGQAYPKNSSKDTDGDSLLDCWEVHGIDYDGDNRIDYQLPGSGLANRLHKDLYVELDLVNPQNDQLTSSQLATINNAVADVVNAFNGAPATTTAPTTNPAKTPGSNTATACATEAAANNGQRPFCMNPDEQAGIRLHVQVDDHMTSPTSTMLNLAFEPCTSALSNAGTTVDFDALKSTFFGTVNDRTAGLKRLNAKRFAFRYGIIGRQLLGQGTTSGCSEIFGNDFVVTPWLWANHGDQGMLNGTIMHEFGHAIGLRHGGGDNANCKPNYLSVMSYSRQVNNQPIPNRRLDYSRQKLPDLNEAALNEPAGVGGPANEQIAYGAPRKPSGVAVYVIAANLPWNLNSDNNTTESGLVADPNNLGSTDCNGANVPSTETRLFGYDDWSNLQYKFQDSFEFADGVASSACTSPKSLPNPPPNPLPQDPGFIVTCGRDRLTDQNDFTKVDETKKAEIRQDLTMEEAAKIAELAAPRFTITMTASPDSVRTSRDLTYTITVKNEGPKTGTNVTVTDALPSKDKARFASATFTNGTSTGKCPNPSPTDILTCNLGSLAVGSSATVTIVVSPKVEGPLTNTAGVSSDPDPSLVQSEDSQTTTVTKGGT